MRPAHECFLEKNNLQSQIVCMAADVWWSNQVESALADGKVRYWTVIDCLDTAFTFFSLF